MSQDSVTQSQNKAIAERLRRIADHIERSTEKVFVKAHTVGGDLRHVALGPYFDPAKDGPAYTQLGHAIFLGGESFVSRATFIEDPCIPQLKHSTKR